MDGRQKPNSQPENDYDLNDEDVIDLNQIVDEDDNDIIDLTNVLEKPDRRADAADASDEDIITLTDAIAEPETIDLPDETDDDIIDLLDMTAAGPSQDNGLSSPSMDESEEDIIDLADPVVDPVAESVMDAGEPRAVGTEESGDADEVADPSDLDLSDADTVEEAAPAEAPLGDERSAKDAAHAATLTSVISPPPSPAAEPIPLTDQQVEDALESVIEKIYSEKIEQLMIQTIEKTVQHEIEKIKNALMEDGDNQDG